MGRVLFGMRVLSEKLCANLVCEFLKGALFFLSVGICLFYVNEGSFVMYEGLVFFVCFGKL